MRNRRTLHSLGQMCRRAALALGAALVILLTVFAREGGAQPPAQAPTPSDLAALFALARDAGPAGVDLGRFRHIEPSSMSADAAAIWPLYEFLLAEALHGRGDTESALAIHRSIVRWATPDPGRDAPSGTAVAAVSLWRLLEERRNGTSAAADRKLFDAAFAYWQSGKRNALGLFEAQPILGALPQLRESLLREMALLAWSLGERRKAYDLLVEYLGVARSGEFEASERQIFEAGVAEAAIVRHSVYLALGKRLDRLGKADQARPLFVEAQQAEEPDIAADARLQLARYLRDANGKPCATPQLHDAVEAVLAAARSAELRQRALLFRARKQLERGCPVNLAAFERDLGQLTREHPRARARFDALAALGEFHLDRHFDTGEDVALGQSLDRFAQARALLASAEAAPAEAQGGFSRGASQRTLEVLGGAWFKPAIALYTRGRVADKRQAAMLLDDLASRWPTGPQRSAAEFWRARIDGEAGERGAAQARLQAIVADSPYDYYAIRARLQLRLGERARHTIVLDDATRAELRDAYTRSHGRDRPALGATPAHRRLAAAIEAGVYRAALASYFTLRRDAFPGQLLEDIDLVELDKVHRLSDVVTVLALRQDALAAADSPATAVNRAQTGRWLSTWASSDWLGGDWPLSVVLAAAQPSPYAVRKALAHDPDYLAIAYPRAYAEAIRREAARASLAPELLYAVIRTETVFNPAAESPRAALGLFQFIPPTFRALNRRWKLVDPADPRAAEAFLLTPQTNIALGARWFREELLPLFEGNVFFALMAHNAGAGAVTRWKSMWQRQGRLDDYELMVETARFEETRAFTKRALAALWIDGAGNAVERNAAR